MSESKVFEIAKRDHPGHMSILPISVEEHYQGYDINTKQPKANKFKRTAFGTFREALRYIHDRGYPIKFKKGELVDKYHNNQLQN